VFKLAAGNCSSVYNNGWQNCLSVQSMRYPSAHNMRTVLYERFRAKCGNFSKIGSRVVDCYGSRVVDCYGSMVVDCYVSRFVD
jgi:hypothetical protein